MKVIEVAIGRSHHFNLARQLHKYENLERFYTGYPRFQFQDEEDIPSEKIISVPYYVTPFMFCDRYQLWPNKKLRDQISFLGHQNLDRTVRNSINEPVILIAYCGAGLYSFKLNKQLGGKNICDKGSTHIEFQEELLQQEYLRYGMKFKGIYEKRKYKEIEEYELCDFITIPSKFVFDSFVKKGVPKEKLKIIPYGTRTSRFKPRIKNFNSKSYPKKNDFNLLFVGNFGARKGAIDILEAFQKFDHPNKKLTIIGSISKEAKKIFKNYDMSNIKLMGRIRNHLLVEYYQRSNVLLIPSIEEGSAIVILEALACGCPVIVTPNAGSEHIKDGFNGFIVPIHSPEKICECLYKISDTVGMKDQLEVNCVETINEINGWDHYAKQWDHLIKSINT